MRSDFRPNHGGEALLSSSTPHNPARRINPHVHVIVPGGGLTADGSRWIACKPGFFLPVRVLSRLFRRLFLDGLEALHETGRLTFFGDLAPLADKCAFDAALAPLRRSEWVVFGKRPFAGPQAVLAYLARYTHRVAISNSRLIRLDEAGVTFKWKDYRIKGRDRLKTMTLDPAEFIRRFLLHVLPSGFHRIRHYGFLASPGRAATIGRLQDLIAASNATARPRHETDATAATAGPEPAAPQDIASQDMARICPCCVRVRQAPPCELTGLA